MKKQLLKNNILSFGTLVLLLGSFNLAQAQNLWTGTTNNLFMTTSNWTTAPNFDGSDNLKITATANNPVLLDNSLATVPAINVIQLQTSPGTELTTASDITVTSTSLYSYFGGKLHITGGTYWGKANIYFGNSASETPYCNIETGGTLKCKSAILVGRNSPCTIDVNGGTITGESGGSAGSIAIGNYYAAGPGIINLNSGLIKIFKVAGFTVGTFGTCNVYGGKIEGPAGDLIVKGVLNVDGGLINLLAGASTINTAATAGEINLKNGSINVAGTLSTINTVINLDSGSLILAGDQTATMATFITNNTIKLSAAATTAGKTITNTYDSATDLTTVKASVPLSVKDFTNDSTFSIYPNPSLGGTFTISFPTVFEESQLSIHNSLGQVIYKTTVGTGSSYDVTPTKNLGSGVYFVTLKSVGKTATQKLIIK